MSEVGENMKESDRMEYLSDGSLIQQGPYNHRIYLMKIGDGVQKGLPLELIKRAGQLGYSKIFAKVPEAKKSDFTAAGYQLEAAVPGFYNGDEGGLFLAYYLNEERSNEGDRELYEHNLQLALERASLESSPLDDSIYQLRPCTESDLDEMARLYGRVFPSYPFPIYDPAYLAETMESHVDYFCIEREGKLLALSSAEMDLENGNVEMTDFATLQVGRGNGLALHLLKRMEVAMRDKGLKTAYTIARAASAGMNITFAKGGYTFGGRLKNNTNISGRIESMNIWYKSL